MIVVPAEIFLLELISEVLSSFALLVVGSDVVSSLLSGHKSTYEAVIVVPAEFFLSELNSEVLSSFAFNPV